MSDKKEITKVLKDLEGADGKELIKALIKSAIQSKGERNPLSSQETIEQLKKIKEDYNKHYKFSEGDIVMWKANLKNRTTPDYGEPAIVLEILEEPIYPDRESGSTYFREPLDLVLGTMAKGELLTFHFDSRKLQPFKESQEDFVEVIEEN